MGLKAPQCSHTSHRCSWLCFGCRGSAQSVAAPCCHSPGGTAHPLHPTTACSHITMISRNKEEGNTQPWKGWCVGSEGRQRGEGDCVRRRRRRGHTAETFRMVRENAFREGEKGGHSLPCTLKFRSSKKHKHRLSVLWIWGAEIKMSMHLHLARWELRVCRQI